MKLKKLFLIPALSLVLGCTARHEQEVKPETLTKGQHMYVIEREMPGLTKLNAEELKAAAQKYRSVLHDLGPQIQWLHSYVTEGKMYCIFLAPNEVMVREHARQGGFPANSVSEVSTIIGPKTAE